ncbi:hypothetical protein FOA43_001975 [Brettanomyces nanus]|uniref:Glutathione S-transferase n=1 Tax=Eeniella nana TaxID=13502 RepID=A0A875S151_EENNA|nr:uncharacterized protein FOA43_001975 [Brettanomyces nanus]QPG74643.1 hypothetical protein FOA43_001975 [Brettanomyces nanus]
MTAQIIAEQGPEVKDATAPYPFLYTWSTSNGARPMILAELLEINYYLHPVDLAAKEQKKPWYLEHNANGKIPTLASTDIDGSTTFVNESAAILLYLADKYDKERKYSYALGSKEYYEELEWLFFELSGFCPKKVQWKYLNNLQEKNQPAIDEQFDEMVRLLRVIDTRLKSNGTGYLVGDHISPADITVYPWIRPGQTVGFEDNIKKLPYLKAWIETIGKIPAVQNALDVNMSLQSRTD